MRKSQLFLGNHIQIRDVGGCFITTFIAPASMIPARCKDQGVFKFDSIWSDPSHGCQCLPLSPACPPNHRMERGPKKTLQFLTCNEAFRGHHLRSRTYQRDQPWRKCHMKMICEGCLSLENTSWTWAWHLRRIWLLQIDVVCMLVAWNVQWKNRQFHKKKSCFLAALPWSFSESYQKTTTRKWSQKWIEMVYVKSPPVDQSGENLQPTNQTGQPTN